MARYKMTQSGGRNGGVGVLGGERNIKQEDHDYK